MTGKLRATVGRVTVSCQLCKSIWSKVSQNVAYSYKQLSLVTDYSPTFISSFSIVDLNCVSFVSVFTRLQVFNSLIELVTSCGNYSQYRKRFSECSGFRFPILGVHLKDLIAVHVALPDWADKEKTMVNLAKTQQLYTILQELALIQTTPPNTDANTDLLNLLTVSEKTKLDRFLIRPDNDLKVRLDEMSHAATGSHFVDFIV